MSFLFYYYIHNYDIKGTSKIYNYKQILYFKLRKFYEYNKVFGRRIIKITRNSNKTVKKEYTFNTNHISFHKINSNNRFSVHSDELLVTRINTTLNLSINNNIFNMVNNALDSDNDTLDDDTSDDDTTINSHHNDIEQINNQLQTLSLGTNTNNDYDEDIDTDDEQNDNGSIS